MSVFDGLPPGPGLTARTTNPGFFVTMANLIGFVVCAWTWRYVKKANRETVKAYRVYVKRL